MKHSEHVVLIHGTWGRGDSLADARRAFEERGFTVHTPTLRYHELPIEEGARLIAPLSLRDFADDLGLGTPQQAERPVRPETAPQREVNPDQGIRLE
jgi:hypothetical protein